MCVCKIDRVPFDCWPSALDCNEAAKVAAINNERKAIRIMANCLLLLRRRRGRRRRHRRRRLLDETARKQPSSAVAVQNTYVCVHMAVFVRVYKE